MTDARAVHGRFVFSFFAPIARLLEDAEVTEVLINGPSEIYAERKGRLTREAVSFSDPDRLLRGLRAAAQYLGSPFDRRHPILEGVLPDGSRIEALLSPLVDVPAAVAIRKHQRNQLSLERLVETGALSAEVVSFLAGVMERRCNLLVAGGTGSGKTSLLNCLASLVGTSERIVTIEDARELALQNPHVLSLLSRPADESGRGRVTIAELFRATLRLRPDRIVIGELRGAEALDLIQAMTSGHGGCLSTLHASSPFDALRRIETMALHAELSLPLDALRSQLASAVHYVVQTERTANGTRGVTRVTEVAGLEDRHAYRLTDVAVRDERGVLVMSGKDHAHEW